MLPPDVQGELGRRFDELSRLEQEQTQLGTSVPQLYGGIQKFIANPSTVSVETYKRILDTDETVGSGIDFLNLCMIARFGDYKHPNSEITTFVRQVLNNLEGGWHGALEEMLSAEWAGFSVSEQVWDYKADFCGGPGFIPTRLVTYQPLTIVFAVDQQGEVLPDGIYQYQRYSSNAFGAGYYGQANLGAFNGFRPDMNAATGDLPYPARISADLSFLTVKIPKQKCITLRSSVTGTFRNPYGRSLLRRIYKNWVLKDAFLKMWVIAADRKGTPLVVGYAAPNDTILSQNGSDRGVSEMRSDQAMAEVFKTIHGSSFVVLPGKKGETYDVEAVRVEGDMNVFKDGVDYFNRAIMRGLLIPPLIMGGDGGGSYSLGQEHHKIFGKIVDGKLKIHKQNILDQFIKKIIQYNFPVSMWQRDGVGEFQLEEYDPEMMNQLSQIFQSLTTSGYMTPDQQSDLDHVRQKMGLPKAQAQEHATIQTVATADEMIDTLDNL